MCFVQFIQVMSLILDTRTRGGKAKHPETSTVQPTQKRLTKESNSLIRAEFEKFKEDLSIELWTVQSCILTLSERSDIVKAMKSSLSVEQANLVTDKAIDHQWENFLKSNGIDVQQLKKQIHSLGKGGSQHDSITNTATNTTINTTTDEERQTDINTTIQLVRDLNTLLIEAKDPEIADSLGLVSTDRATVLWKRLLGKYKEISNITTISSTELRDVMRQAETILFDFGQELYHLEPDIQTWMKNNDLCSASDFAELDSTSTLAFTSTENGRRGGDRTKKRATKLGELDPSRVKSTLRHIFDISASPWSLLISSRLPTFEASILLDDFSNAADFSFDCRKISRTRAIGTYSVLFESITTSNFFELDIFPISLFNSRT